MRFFDPALQYQEQNAKSLTPDDVWIPFNVRSVGVAGNPNSIADINDSIPSNSINFGAYLNYVLARGNTGTIRNTGNIVNTGIITNTGTITSTGVSTSTGITNNGNYTGNGNLTVTGVVQASNNFNTTQGGLLTAGTEVLLGGIIGANFNVTTDQGVALLRIGTKKYMITRILVTNASISLTTAAGGFYTDVTKGGVAVVAASQAYSALTTATTVLSTTLTVSRTHTTTPLYLSLTTAQGAAATADVYIFGIILP